MYFISQLIMVTEESTLVSIALNTTDRIIKHAQHAKTLADTASFDSLYHIATALRLVKEYVRALETLEERLYAIAALTYEEKTSLEDQLDNLINLSTILDTMIGMSRMHKAIGKICKVAEDLHQMITNLQKITS